MLGRNYYTVLIPPGYDLPSMMNEIRLWKGDTRNFLVMREKLQNVIDVRVF